MQLAISSSSLGSGSQQVRASFDITRWGDVRETAQIFEQYVGSRCTSL